MDSAEPKQLRYVLDTSAAINLERSDRIGRLEPPGNSLMVPSGVAREMNPDNPGTPLDTKKWLSRGIISHFNDNNEEALYKSLILNPAVDDGEAQAMTLAYYRNATLVIDEKKQGEVWRIAQSYGIHCITSDEYWDIICPKLPGF